MERASRGHFGRRDNSQQRLRSGKSFIERPIQHLYPLELACDVSTQIKAITLNAEAKEFRPSRRSAVSARRQMRAIASAEDDED